MECFGEMLAEHSIIVALIESPTEDIVVRLYDHEGKAHRTLARHREIKLSHAAEKTGTHTLCIDNVGTQSLNIKVSIKTGVEAKIYTDLATTSHFKPIELDVYKMERVLESIQADTKFIIHREEARLRHHDDISFKMTVFSVVTLILLSILAYFQSAYLKNFFRSKKLL
eukprot:TRINITY_DN7092_c0_g1_i2.p1 TRINITY_DN7092_c0_g1~~TRINITY_DN7092_c0_g1_i2.p1  ORF type:complete len:169 (+),score=38.35 TRINITY_DN7092_c0_g1_i2:147-653(+)